MYFQCVSESIPGRFVQYKADHPDGLCVAAALGFDTGADTLHPDHRRVLAAFAAHQERIVLMDLFGRSDRAGRAVPARPGGWSNMLLSKMRATRVRNELVSLGLPNLLMAPPYCRGLGEGFDADLGVRNHHRSQGGRSAWVFAWPSKRAYADGLASNLSDLLIYGRSRGETA